MTKDDLHETLERIPAEMTGEYFGSLWGPFDTRSGCLTKSGKPIIACCLPGDVIPAFYITVSRFLMELQAGTIHQTGEQTT